MYCMQEKRRGAERDGTTQNNGGTLASQVGGNKTGNFLSPRIKGEKKKKEELPSN